MEDTLEVCSGCGKMPRALDYLGGIFTCSRCGNHAIMPVTSAQYEKVVSELDQRFHAGIMKQKAASVAHEPIEFSRPKKKPGKAKKSPANVNSSKKAVKNAGKKKKR